MRHIGLWVTAVILAFLLAVVVAGVAWENRFQSPLDECRERAANEAPDRIIDCF